MQIPFKKDKYDNIIRSTACCNIFLKEYGYYEKGNYSQSSMVFVYTGIIV